MRTIKRVIVSALIYSKDGQLLMGKKDPEKGGVYNDCWHLPGGGIEEGENKLQALIREVQEEVDIDIAKYPIEFVTDKDSGTAEKRLKTGEKVLVEMQFNVYKVVIADKKSNEIKTKLHDDLVEVQWFSIQELSMVKLTPPSIKYFKEIGYLS